MQKHKSLGFIYGYLKLYDPETIKIGSTMELIARIQSYITVEKNFNSMTHKIWSYEIIESEYDCYTIDDIIQYISKTYNEPYKHYDGDAGTEHYLFTEIEALSKFLDKLNIKYILKEIDIAELKKQIKDKYSENLKKIIKETVKEKNPKIKDILEEIDIKFKNENNFALYKYQKEILDLTKVTNDRLFHLIIAPTGTGKTVIMSTIGIQKIESSKKDIMIITKRKEILEQMINKIPDNIQKIKDAKIVDTEITPTIINCLNNCSLKKLNQKNKNQSVYLINFDKFTGSKFDYNDIKFDKFQMIIIDESHWVGADKINEFMIYLKDKTKTEVIGFSATPIRCQRKHKSNTIQLFKNKQNADEINILYEYSYYDALITDKIICPIKWMPIVIKENNFIDEDSESSDDESDDNSVASQRVCKIINPNSYKTIWKNIRNNIVSKSFKKKGILWFRTRKEMLSFYKHMKDELKDFTLCCTMIFNETEKDISELVKGCNLDKIHFENALINFVKCKDNAILLSVFRAIEGFDDVIVDFGVRMYYSNHTDAVTETQRMGRMNRKCDGKNAGYFATLEVEFDKEKMKQDIINRLKNWVAFARSYSKKKNNNKEEKEIQEKQMREIIERYIDTEILEIHNIDIEKEIIRDYELTNSDKYWLSCLEKAQECINKIHKRPSEEDDDKRIRSIGMWISDQRKNYKNQSDMMKRENIRKLFEQFIEKNKIYFKSPDDVWLKRYEECEEYTKKHDKFPPGTKNSSHIPLRRWIYYQILNFETRTGMMSQDNLYNIWKEFMNKYPHLFEDNSQTWKNNCDKVEDYIIKEKEVPSSGDKNKEVAKLGSWLNHQKISFNDETGIMKKEEIRIIWMLFEYRYADDLLDNYGTWEKKFGLLQKEIAENKKLPSATSAIGNWLCLQKANFRKREQIMKDDMIHNKFKKFMEDNKELFLDSKKEWKGNLEEIQKSIDTNKKKPTYQTSNKKMNNQAKWLYRQQQNYPKKSGIMEHADIRKLWEDFIKKNKQYFSIDIKQKKINKQNKKISYNTGSESDSE
jgi:hypothetical protein